MKQFKFDRTHVVLIVVCLVAFVSALVCDENYTPNRNMVRYKNIIESDLHQKEKQVEELFGHTVNNQLLLNYKSTALPKREMTTIDSLFNSQNNNFTYLIFADSVYQFWTKSECQFPKESDLAQMQPTLKDSISLYQTNNSFYELRFHHTDLFFRGVTKPVILCALIPIKQSYSNFEGEYLTTHFAVSQNIPTEINVVSPNVPENSKNITVSISTNDNLPLCQLSYKAGANIADATRDRTIAIFLIIGFVFLGFFFNRIAKEIVLEERGSSFSWFIFFVLLGCLRYLVWMAQKHISLPTLFVRPDLLSVQQIWIETLFFFWFANFISKNYRFDLLKNTSDRVKITIAALFTLVSVTFFNIFIFIVHLLVTKLAHSVSFDNLVNFNSESIVTIVALGLILVSILILSLRVVDFIKQLNLSNLLILMLLLEILLFVGWFFSTYTEIPIWYHLSFCVAFALVLACFEVVRFNVYLNLLLLLFFSVSISGLIYAFNQVKDEGNLISSAKTLLMPTDSLASIHLDSIRKNIIDKTVAPEEVTQIDKRQFVIDSVIKDFKQNIDRVLELDPYINSHYDLNYVISDSRSLILSSGNTVGSPDFLAQSRNSSKDAVRQNILVSTNGLNAQYFTFPHLKTVNNNDADIIVQIRCTRNNKVRSVLYSEVFSHFTFKGITDLSRYKYDIFNTNAPNVPIPDSINLKTIKSDGYKEYKNRDEIGLFYRLRDKDHDKTIKISVENRLDTQFKSLFAQTIIIILSLGFVLLLANYFLHFLPSYFDNVITPVKGSISTRIILPVSMLLFVSFFFIYNGFESMYVRINQNLYQTEIQPKIESSLRQTAEKITGIWSETTRKNKQNLLDSLMQSVDVDKSESLHFYQTNGKDLLTSHNVLYNNGLSSDYMEAKAFWDMTTHNLNYLEQESNLGKFKYKSIFVAVSDANNNRIGYLEKSLYSSYRKSLKDLETTRINTIFWLPILYIITIVIIFLIINTFIIKPIQIVSDNLEKLDIEQFSGHEKIEYQYNDEIKILVDAHNKLIPEMKSKLKLMEESQRNLAFRQMAQQIAHDIKNPLSPINMGAQLVLSLDDDFDTADFRDQTRVTMQVIVDQVRVIDRLTKDLRNFAIGPENSNNETFDLNATVISVKNLMEAEFKSKNISLNVSVPEEKIFIYADSIIINRALTNLVKNGEQAISSGTQGLINIYLEKVDDKARITISDSGDGIPEEIQERIFEASFTTKPTGNGLGLSITKQIVVASNGTIRFVTKKGVGTDFIIDFPIRHTEFASSSHNDNEVQPSETIRIPSRSSS